MNIIVEARVDGRDAWFILEAEGDPENQADIARVMDLIAQNLQADELAQHNIHIIGEASTKEEAMRLLGIKRIVDPRH